MSMAMVTGDGGGGGSGGDGHGDNDPGRVGCICRAMEGLALSTFSGLVCGGGGMLRGFLSTGG